jgi:hypothetical protein
MVFLPAIRAAHPQAESISDDVASGSTPPTGNGSEPEPTNATGGPGPTSISSARFSATMQPPTGPIRKQNIACDACRSRKIRCQRMTIEQIVRLLYLTLSDWLMRISVNNVKGEDLNVLPITSCSLLRVNLRKGVQERDGGRVRMQRRGMYEYKWTGLCLRRRSRWNVLLWKEPLLPVVLGTCASCQYITLCGADPPVRDPHLSAVRY